ncbi:MAG: hypothetical protein CR997_02790 [Acidobacteria bacterium]|nr:MAG: hypothetical protein CR997_02790 [Acidobacteriota bacterium]
MKNCLALFCLLGCSVSIWAQEIKVPGGTFVTVELMENINSKLNQTGDRVYCQVVEDVVVDDHVVIEAGALAVGHVKDLKRSAAVGRSGSLKFIIKHVEAVDGQKIRIIRDSLSTEGRTRGGAVVAHSIMWGPLGLLAKGRQANALKGTEYELETRSDVIIDVSKTKKKSEPQEWENTFQAYSKKKRNMVNLAKGKSKEKFEIVVEGIDLRSEFEIVKINQFTLPEPLKVAFKRGDTIGFDWWSVFKFCVPTKNEIFLKATQPDGTVRFASFTFSSRWKLD